MMVRASCGECAAPGDVSAIGRALVSLIARWRSGFRRTEPPSDLILQFDRAVQAERLAAILHRVAGTPQTWT
jgi:hypothetical protein